MLELAKELGVSELISDMFEDIGLGICGMQTLRNNEMLITTKKKLKKYKQKTPIPTIIEEILMPVLNDIRLENQWKYENEFVSKETKITLIQWFNDDSCMIKYDDEKEIKVNKKYFRELYESRNEIPEQHEWEQLKLIV